MLVPIPVSSFSQSFPAVAIIEVNPPMDMQVSKTILMVKTFVTTLSKPTALLN